MSSVIDLGDGYELRWVSWAPDRKLNPHFEHLPDVVRYAAIVKCPHGEGFILFDNEVSRETDPEREKWTIKSWEPLTIEPSIMCPPCGCHGFIHEGKWVNA